MRRMSLVIAAVIAAFVVSPAYAQVVPFGTMAGGGGGTTTIISGTTPITGGGDTQICFNDASVLSCGDAGLTYVKGTDKLTVLGGVTVGSVTTAGRATSIFLDTWASAGSILAITGTFPGTLSAETSGILFSLTADDDAQIQNGLKSLLSGAGGTLTTAALRGESAATGSISGGVIGLSTGAATLRYGGFFGLGSVVPTGASGALLANNGAVAADIFRAMDNGTAVFTIADGGVSTFTQGTLFAAGTAGAPGIAWSADADGTGTGFYRLNANRIAVSNGGTGSIEFGDGTIYIPGASGVRFVTVLNGALQASLMSEGTAIFELGVDVNGAAVAQTLKAHDGITGTDIAGARLTLAGGRGTGAGAAGNLRIQTAIPVGTGTTAQVLADRELFVAPNLAVADNTATTMFTVTLGDDTDGGGIVDFCAMATSAATDRQKTCGQIAFSGVDVTSGAGGETCSAAITGTNSTAVSVGTLTVTSAATTGTDLCNIQITSDSSLNVAHVVRYSVRLHPSASTVVITPQ